MCVDLTERLSAELKRRNVCDVELIEADLCDHMRGVEVACRLNGALAFFFFDNRMSDGGEGHRVTAQKSIPRFAERIANVASFYKSNS